MKIKKINHIFVTNIPDKLEVGILYISIQYKTAIHKCACGCGEEVVTPISPVGWRITYNGETVSLYPSIGNWSYKCKSHYWITNNNIIWAEEWSDEKIEVARRIEGRNIQNYFNKKVL